MFVDAGKIRTENKSCMVESVIVFMNNASEMLNISCLLSPSSSSFSLPRGAFLLLRPSRPLSSRCVYFQRYEI